MTVKPPHEQFDRDTEPTGAETASPNSQQTARASAGLGPRGSKRPRCRNTYPCGYGKDRTKSYPGGSAGYGAKMFNKCMPKVLPSDENAIRCMYVCMHACMRVCMYVCMCMCMCMCIYIYIYIYIGCTHYVYIQMPIHI